MAIGRTNGQASGKPKTTIILPNADMSGRDAYQSYQIQNRNPNLVVNYISQGDYYAQASSGNLNIHVSNPASSTGSVNYYIQPVMSATRYIVSVKGTFTQTGISQILIHDKYFTAASVTIDYTFVTSNNRIPLSFGCFTTAGAGTCNGNLTEITLTPLQF